MYVLKVKKNDILKYEELYIDLFQNLKDIFIFLKKDYQ